MCDLGEPVSPIVNIILSLKSRACSPQRTVINAQTLALRVPGSDVVVSWSMGQRASSVPRRGSVLSWNSTKAARCSAVSLTQIVHAPRAAAIRPPTTKQAVVAW
jgi:hypothetical protein